MKVRFLAVLFLLGFLLTGCGREKDYSEYPFVNVRWERFAEADTEYISFSADGSFGYYCACGNPVNDSDLCEGYSYDESTRTITLEYVEDTAESVRKVMIKECTADRLVLDFDGEIRSFHRYSEEE